VGWGKGQEGGWDVVRVKPKDHVLKFQNTICERTQTYRQTCQPNPARVLRGDRHQPNFSGPVPGFITILSRLFTGMKKKTHRKRIKAYPQRMLAVGVRVLLAIVT
jgi:hypothetical protein